MSTTEFDPTVAQAEFWDAFLRRIDDRDSYEKRGYSAWYFCDNENDADELADLVVRGTKRATASLKLSYEAEGEALPSVGDLSMITRWNGEPVAIIETTRVDIVPFREVSAEFAATEGEGDGSLEYWRRGHRRFFSQECRDAGTEFSENMDVVCERFEAIYGSPE